MLFGRYCGKLVQYYVCKSSNSDTYAFIFASLYEKNMTLRYEVISQHFLKTYPTNMIRIITHVMRKNFNYFMNTKIDENKLIILPVYH